MRQEGLEHSRGFSEVADGNIFSDLSQVHEAVIDYIERLKVISYDQAVRGKKIEDEDHSIDVFSLKPPSPSRSPIILIGGMGPLAGIVGFDFACQFSGYKREIILYQACSIPNRMTVIQDPNRIVNGLSLNQYLVEQVSTAIIEATKYLPSNSTDVTVILLCNAVHHFLPQIQKKIQRCYPTVASSIQYLSLIEAAIKNLKNQKLYKPLLLGSSATRITRLYCEPLEKSGIKCQHLSRSAQEILMSAIYQGIKSFDREYACMKGEELFNSLQAGCLDIDSIIAGCTEVPILLNWLQAPIKDFMVKSSNQDISGKVYEGGHLVPKKIKNKFYSIQDFLTHVKVINPLESALRQLE